MLSKIQNDKYYTPIHIANSCWDKVLTVIGADNISEVIEPSVGNGAFLKHKKGFVHFAYDIAPECCSETTQIITGDYLKADISYLPGRLVIGNPPYGERMYLAQQFYRKSVQIADYIAFILPISQLNNVETLYAFDLVSSTDLGVQQYSDCKLHCCFNIYCRPADGVVNRKKHTKLQDVTIIRQDSKDYATHAYDLRMCYWGDGTAGKVLQPEEHYAAEYKICVNNTALKAKVLQVLQTVNWHDYLQNISARKIHQFQIIEVLKQAIPEIR